MKKLLTVIALALSSTLAYADSDKLAVPGHPKWKAECGSCHIAFPPGLLTAENWQQMMGELDKHFGANAVLPPQDNKEILNFLQRHASKNDKHSAKSTRISETPWFTREHRKVSQSTWADPAVKSRSNCTACHKDGERGDWSERGISMPGGRQMNERSGYKSSGKHDEEKEHSRKEKHDND